MPQSGVERVFINNAAGENKYIADSEDSAKQCPKKLLHNIKGIIFDFDGTLFDNVKIPIRLITAYPPDLFRLRNERLIRKQFTGSDYSTPDEFYKAFFKAMGKACLRSPEKMRSWYFNKYMPRMVRVLKKHYKPRPGVQSVLENMSSLTGNRKIAVYSDYPFLRQRMEALELNPGQDILLYGPESFGAQKPAVRPFLQIARDLGVKPEEVLVIGDREETDGFGAFRAGMRFFCLETGRRRYFMLDPNRRRLDETPKGPSLVMYVGAWDDLVKLLLNK